MTKICDQICQKVPCSHTISMFTFQYHALDRYRNKLTVHVCAIYSQNFRSLHLRTKATFINLSDVCKCSTGNL